MKKKHIKFLIIATGTIIVMLFYCNGVFAAKDRAVVSETSSKFIERITQKNTCLGLISLDEKMLRKKFCNLYNKEKNEKVYQ